MKHKKVAYDPKPTRAQNAFFQIALSGNFGLDRMLIDNDPQEKIYQIENLQSGRSAFLDYAQTQLEKML